MTGIIKSSWRKPAVPTRHARISAWISTIPIPTSPAWRNPWAGIPKARSKTLTISNPRSSAPSNKSNRENPRSSTPFAIGETSVFEEPDNGNGNLLLAQDAILSQPGTLQSLSFYVTVASGGLRLGLYDATGPGGGPGAKKAETAAFTPVVGWNTVSVIAPVALPPGNYWLAYLPQSNALSFSANRGIGQFRYYAYPYGPMPATFSTSPSGGVTRWSFYGTLVP